MLSGTIKQLVADRGFGFIRDDGGLDWFFRRDGVQGSFDLLRKGQRVSFEEARPRKAPSRPRSAARNKVAVPGHHRPAVARIRSINGAGYTPSHTSRMLSAASVRPPASGTPGASGAAVGSDGCMNIATMTRR